MLPTGSSLWEKKNRDKNHSLILRDAVMDLLLSSLDFSLDMLHIEA
jgi:hypothetical protein